MARKPTGNPVGRPPKHINWEEFEKLCNLQCTQSEIASFLGVHHETLTIRVQDQYGEEYPKVYKRFSEGGKCSLRRNQFQLSKKNSSMAIWLGKQWLGQKDISKEEVQDIAQDIINAVRESEKESRISEAERSDMETEQSLLDQRPTREENQISGELGAEGTI